MSHAGPTPAIRVIDPGSRHGRYPNSHRSDSHVSPSIAMAIPNAQEAPPPPLPPPRYISEMAGGLDPGWEWANRRRESDAEPPTVRADSSLARGGQTVSGERGEQNEYRRSRRENSTSNFIDIEMSEETQSQSEEDRNGLIRPSLANHRLQSERQLGQKALENSSQAYDKQLLSKIGGPSTGNRGPGANFLPATSQEGTSAPRNAFHELSGQLKPLTMPPERRYSAIESPISRWPVGNSSGVSPGASGFRSPLFEHGPADNVFSRRTNSADTPDCAEDTPTGMSRSHRGSDDQGVFMDPDFADENGMRDLHIHDRSPSGSEEQQLGKRRRGDSPQADAAREERMPRGKPNEIYRRRSQQMLGNRNSPISRFQTNHGSVSSASSLGQRTGSLASSWGLSIGGSSVTSYSGDRLSPGAMSPSVDLTEFGPASPFATNRSLNPSPRGSLSKNQHQRHVSDNERTQGRKMSADNQNHSRQNSISKIQGLYICECCPKKPKKFDSEEELRLHELEKQYQCQYCPNRFKNKNEAERHQNSLHLRRHSWSCAALAGVHAAFHPSTIHPTTFDVCGYCGEEFPNNPANWDARAEHLNHVHKFGECNQAKKFFRADHFRQHLKHSHAGTSGKWTNMLENACMKDEPIPPPLKDRMGSIVSPSGISTAPAISSPIAGAASMVNITSPQAQGQPSLPGIIDEAHEES